METNVIYVILGMGVVTYLPRALPLLGLSRLNMPRIFLTWLSMVPAAVLASLTIQSLVRCGSEGLQANWLYIAAALPCLGIALKTRSMLWVVIAGMILVVAGRFMGFR